MAVEQTKEGMKYNWELSSKGMAVTLFPVKGRHNQDAIKRAKTQVRKDHLIAVVDLEWISIHEHDSLELTTPTEVSARIDVNE